ESGHLDFSSIESRHEHHSELGANCVGLGKNFQDLLRRSIGSDVIILRLAAQQQIAHASAYEKSLKAALAQGLYHRDGKIFQHFSNNIVLCLVLTSSASKAPATRPQRLWYVRANN